MTILRSPLAALAWLGRHGQVALTVSVFLGVAVPQLAVYVKPYLSETVFVLLLFSYLRTDPQAFRAVVRKPALAIVASLWVMIGVPLLFGGIYLAADVPTRLPELYTILVLQAAIAPITSAAAFAALTGLDVALTLAGLILCNLLSPVTTVAMSMLFLGTVMISPLVLGGKLLVFYVASAVVAYGIRRATGPSFIVRNREVIDGLNVVVAFIFVIAAMENVSRYFINEPMVALGVLALVLAVTFSQLIFTALVFWRAGLDHSLVIAMLGGLRNQGTFMAAMGAAMPDLAWFYFAMAQFPIYIFPLLLKPLAKRLTKNR